MSVKKTRHGCKSLLLPYSLLGSQTLMFKKRDDNNTLSVDCHSEQSEESHAGTLPSYTARSFATLRMTLHFNYFSLHFAEVLRLREIKSKILNQSQSSKNRINNQIIECATQGRSIYLRQGAPCGRGYESRRSPDRICPNRS